MDFKASIVLAIPKTITEAIVCKHCGIQWSEQGFSTLYSKLVEKAIENESSDYEGDERG